MHLSRETKRYAVEVLDIPKKVIEDALNKLAQHCEKINKNESDKDLHNYLMEE